MTHYTLLVRFSGPPPSVHARQEVMGGELEAVQFNDAFAELDALRAALHAIGEADTLEDAREIADDALNQELTFQEAVLTTALSPEPSDPPNSTPDPRSRGTGDPRKPESR